tara:strand:- start:1868 stop:3397 length:1530 start_codon:yes stop_codon:yes gene_type:complete
MKINNIVILGGGSAGWMTASTLCKRFPNKKITVIESPSEPTVGVGESTLQHIRKWTSFVGLNEKEFFKATDASLKLSIKFTDFYKKGEAFHYPFGVSYTKGNINEINDWWFKKILYPETKNTDFADCLYPVMALVNNNTITDTEVHDLPYNYLFDTALHFDATKFAIYLRDNICKLNGVKHIKEDIKSIEQDKAGIKSLNKKYKADLFIDCTGFKSLLMGKTLNEPFESYEDLLPNNSAWATRMPYKNKKKELVPYTNCTAIENGWVWNIPLWSRVGTGYVYSDKFVDDQTALKQLQKHLGTKELEFRNIKIRTGIHNRLWVKNVCTIGLSAGFIEPLESNGLFSVHEFLSQLCRVLDRGEVNQFDKDAFTHICKLTFRNFAEFVALHYAFTSREDTPYWKHLKNKEWSKSIIDLSNDYQNGLLNAVKGKYIDYSYAVNSGLAAISAGFNWAPCDLQSICYNNFTDEIKEPKQIWESQIKVLNKRKKIWNEAAKKLPSLHDFLKDKFYG